jgi:hypothetical protein
LESYNSQKTVGVNALKSDAATRSWKDLEIYNKPLLEYYLL